VLGEDAGTNMKSPPPIGGGSVSKAKRG